MARLVALPALCGLMALQCFFHQGAAETSIGGGDVQFAWVPSETCVDDPFDPKWNCQQCNQFDSKCLVCKAGYSFDAQNRCAKCWNPLCLTCARAVAGVPRANTCNLCKGVPDSDPFSYANPNYPIYKNATGWCLKCASQAANTGCLQCDATGSRCTRCNDGYALVGGQCKKCGGGDQCKTCGPDLVCTQCRAQLYLPAYGLNSAKECVPCASEQCVDCNANYQKCKKCMDGAVGTGQRGYGVNAAGGCSLCTDRLCGKCSTNANKCWGCLSDDFRPFYPYMDPSGVCKAGTVAHCLHYTSAGACRECATGYKLDGGKCYFLPKCVDANCLDCRGNVNACRPDGCRDGWFYFATLKRCQPCNIAKCASCNSQPRKLCDRCVTGFGLNAAKTACSKCAPQNPDPQNVPWCQRCDGNTNFCKLCFPAEMYKPNALGRCVPRV